MAESDIVAVAIASCISIYQNSVISLYHFTNRNNRIVPMMLVKLPIMLCSNAPELCLLCSIYAPYVNYCMLANSTFCFFYIIIYKIIVVCLVPLQSSTYIINNLSMHVAM